MRCISPAFRVTRGYTASTGVILPRVVYVFQIYRCRMHTLGALDPHPGYVVFLMRISLPQV
jgi:hypothetical protein